MNKIVKIGFPMEYEDDKHIIRTGLWLKEYEVEALEKRLNEYNHLQSKIDKANKYLEEHTDKLGKIKIPKIDFNYNELSDILKEVENVENN